MSEILIRNAKSIIGVEKSKEEKLKYSGKEMKNFPTIENAYLLISNGKISEFGPMKECPERAEEIIDLDGQHILPAWCDSHTHIIYESSREQEFVGRIKGLSYEEIAENGGGILNSAKALQNSSESKLYDQAEKRLNEVISFGTGAIEIKSGYGLTVESELKMLRVARKLKENYDLEIKTTFLGAHAFPQEFKNNRKGYIDLIENQMLPQIIDEGLADYIDVFCDRGFYTVEETDYLIKLGKKYGLQAKIHANELDYSGGVQIGVKNNILSVDHLEKTGQEEIDSLKGSDTMPTLLPSTAFFLGIDYAPARKMIDEGLAVAVATDYNPGSTPSGKMPFVLSLSCLKMNMLPIESIAAATINGAYAMELSKSHGTISKGKNANIIITKKIPSADYIPYAFGSDHIQHVMIKGEFY